MTFSKNNSSDNTDIPLRRCLDLVIKSNTPKGRGVFATKDIPAGTVIDVCPVLVLALEENKRHIEQTSLYHFTYNWPTVDANGDSKMTQAVIFGLGSMFNHSTQHQNIGWMRDPDRFFVTYRALRDIQAGEELCISYGSRLTFKDVDAPTVPSLEKEEVEFEHLRMMQSY